MDETNSNGQPPVEPPTAPNPQGVQCLKCAKVFTVLPVVPEVVNELRFSMIIWPHERTQSCPHCGQHYAMQIQALKGIVSAWIPVQTPNTGRVITPPSGLVV